MMRSPRSSHSLPLIKARADAGMTQGQVAAAMGTTQAAIARLESGRLKPTTRTLEQFAKATRTRLRISFEPDKAAADRRARPRPTAMSLLRPQIPANQAENFMTQ